MGTPFARALLVMAPILVACSDGGGGGPDAAPLVRSDRDHVIARYTLPVTFEDVDAASFRWPNEDAPVNNLGTTTVALLDLLEGIPVQDDLEAGMVAGTSLQALRLHSAAPENDPAATTAFGDLVDADQPADPSNDFGGDGQFELAVGASLEGYADGALDNDVFEGESDTATLIVGLPLVLGQAVTRLHVSAPRITVEVSDAGLTGAFGAAVTEDDLHADLYPAIASLVTRAITENTPNAASLRSIFDADSNGTVTVAELIASPTLQQLTRPDLDLDGDGVEEHLSTGLSFEAVPAEILP